MSCSAPFALQGPSPFLGKKDIPIVGKRCTGPVSQERGNETEEFIAALDGLGKQIPVQLATANMEHWTSALILTLESSSAFVTKR